MSDLVGYQKTGSYISAMVISREKQTVLGEELIRLTCLCRRIDVGSFSFYCTQVDIIILTYRNNPSYTSMAILIFLSVRSNTDQIRMELRPCKANLVCSRN